MNQYFPGDSERLPAGAHDPQLGTCAEQRESGTSGSLGDVLTVVEDDGRVTFADAIDDAQQRPAGRRVVRRRRVRCTDCCGDGLGDRDRIEDRGEFDVPHLAFGGPSGDGLHQQPRLADSARSDHRDDPVPRHRLGELGELRRPPDERRQVRRQDGHSTGRRQRHRRGERGVLRQHGAFQRLQFRSDVETELVRETLADPLIRGERVGLPPTSIQGDDQLSVETFVPGMFRNERLDRGQELGVSSESEACIDVALVGAQQQLREARRSAPANGRSSTPASGVPWASAVAAVKRSDASARSPRERGRPTLVEAAFHDQRVDVIGLDGEPVSPVAMPDGVVANSATELGDLRLEGVERVAERRLAPDAVDEPVGRHAVRDGQGECAEYSLELRADDRDPLIATRRAHAVEHAHAQRFHGVQRSHAGARCARDLF